MNDNVRPRLEWRNSKEPDATEHNRAVVKEIARMLKAGEIHAVLGVLRDWPPSDTIALLVQLPLKRARRLFLSMPAAPAARVVAELNDDFRVALLEDATIERIASILDSLDPEVADRALDQLPDDAQERILDKLGQADSVRELRAFREESAGSIMTRKLVAVPPLWTVGQVVSEVRKNADLIKKFHSVYVIDQDHRLLGYLKLRDLLLRPSEAPVSQVLRNDLVVVRSDMDQEEVVRISERHELTDIPVVDAQGRLLGRITAEDLQKVVRDEAEEDIHLMGGVAADTRPDEPVVRIVKTRLPWLIAGLIGATISGSIVGLYEDQIAAAAILASFIPIVMSLAGNAGIQAATVAIQGLATGTIWLGDLGPRLLKELTAALLNGSIAALLLVSVVLIASQFVLVDDPVQLALTAGLSLVTVTVLAVALGAAVPLILHRLGIDPAMATGIFITTGNDIIAVLVFFFVATRLYLA